ncbi:hypothetical protein BH753_gp069 [Bacillus phage Shbh1]|uniref:Uncharacterized protein n=1 Tax=Bacillus phage Shbh1 TaxID=1796992 RepID=A0A142F194_9CAUD|nr:hypothetical protein BH753_gp069 [Bacillus phage Shbh1]AMQ66551.1 hypothetical protein [Bacillus phage Shbh1]
MKQIIKIHIEHELDEEFISEYEQASEEERNNVMKNVVEVLKEDFNEFSEESIKQFDVYLVKETEVRVLPTGMIVKELIEKLKEMPQSKEVILYDKEFNEDIEITDVVDGGGSTVYIDFN